MPPEHLLVTGASSDLGLATIRRVLATPDPPVVLAHGHASMDRIEALRDELGADHVVPLRANLEDSVEVVALADKILAEFGAPAGFVHLPGLKLRYERFVKWDAAHFRRDMALQVESAAALLGRLLPKMATLPRAKVVFVLSSVTRGIPPKLLSMYTVVKHAELGLMKALAAEYVTSKMTINAVSPGMVDTRFLSQLPEVAVQLAAKSHPQGKNAGVDDIVGAILFLLGTDSDYVTGAEIPVTGGAAF
jgi:NAD(P)-dependent dehydrogenase (short-subunit alcohol dehydrogenase family)